MLEYLFVFTGGHVTGKPNSLQEAKLYCAAGDGKCHFVNMLLLQGPPTLHNVVRPSVFHKMMSYVATGSLAELKLDEEIAYLCRTARNSCYSFEVKR